MQLSTAQSRGRRYGVLLLLCGRQGTAHEINRRYGNVPEAAAVALLGSVPLLEIACSLAMSRFSSPLSGPGCCI